MQAGMHPDTREGSKALRILSISPPGLDSDVLIEIMLADIVNITEVGIIVHVETRGLFHICLDFAYFSRDYMQAAKSNDWSGHTAKTPYMACTARCLSCVGAGSDSAKRTSLDSSCNLGI